jgi:hypothetical protein
VLAGAQAGRAGEDGAAGVVDVLVERTRGQGPLQPDELGRVLHERDEEQAAEQGADLRVDAVGERVAAAQDARSPVVLIPTISAASSPARSPITNVGSTRRPLCFKTCCSRA